jgi:hypothetical protein
MESNLTVYGPVQYPCLGLFAKPGVVLLKNEIHYQNGGLL